MNETTSTSPAALTPEQINAEIERRNKAFAKATKAQKRVLIAKDVLKFVEEKKIMAKRGVFVNYYQIHTPIGQARVAYSKIMYGNSPSRDADLHAANVSLQPLILLPTPVPCEACALGGLMLACTLNNNKERVTDLEDDFGYLGFRLFPSSNISPTEREKKVKNELDKFFTVKQLVLIETTFEWVVDSDYTSSTDFISENEGYARQTGEYDLSPSVERRSKAFAFKYPEPKARLVAIMKNIIKNKGTFKL